MTKPYTCCNFRRNPPQGKEDELAEGLLRALIKDSNTPTPFLAIPWGHTPPPTLPPTPVPSFTKRLCL